MIHIREVLRRLTMGKRTEQYWRELRSQELKRLGYDVGKARNQKPRKAR